MQTVKLLGGEKKNTIFQTEISHQQSFGSQKDKRTLQF